MPVCPVCARRLPSTVATCRCGHTFDLADLVSIEPAHESAAGGSRSSLRFGVLMFGLVAVSGATLWMKRDRSPIRTLQTTADASPAARNRAQVTRQITKRLPSDPPTPAAADAPDAIAPEPPDAAARVAAALARSKAAAAAASANAPASAPAASLEDLVSRSMPAVVRVETSSSIGSGFFIAPDTILTNEHVVSGNSLVTIRRPGGATQTARVDTTARELDMAVMKISTPEPNQPVLVLGSGTSARPGQEVVALGSPLGLQNTVTRGIVSAVRDVGGLTLVQTDAAINPGNSGGPLLDRSGQVIGITSLGMRSSVAQGLGFAIAIEHAQVLLSGRRPAGATGTPLATLNKAMGGDNTSADARDRASKTYEQRVAMVARRADTLDGQWQTFVSSCYQGPIVGSFERPWYALWEARAMPGAVRDGCTTFFTDIRRVAGEIRSTVGALDEAARREDVYPGTRREILRRYRLDYSW
ncbi:MAG TPA: trypsin-like peptidase domain-containing protein [Vicinamibacterales bacterium]|nr:trypsin-like peptidase domain-containing protein [Vicinamibacterales bacterium]